MKTAPSRYSAVSREKAHGATYTPAALAGFVAGQIASRVAQGAGRPIRILDPAVGDGVLLVSMVRALQERGHSDFTVTGFDTDSNALAQTRDRFAREFPAVRAAIHKGDFLDVAAGSSPNPDLLNASPPVARFDVVIANPPYVRTQVLGAARAGLLAKRYGLTGRVDLYYAFLIAISRVMDENGILGIIISNRFMTTRSGQAVRKALQDSYELLHVWDLGDTKLFDAAVLPAVILARNVADRKRGTPPRFTSIYETTKPPCARAAYPIDALSHPGIVEIEDGRRFDVVDGVLDTNGQDCGVWRAATAEKDEWLTTVKDHTFARFGDIGKIRVGVKTTADNVFIRDDWNTLPQDMRPEVLRNLTTHHVARRYRALDKDARQILYTHLTVNGRRCAIELERYPRAQAYLESHRQQLQSRAYVTKAGRRWYEIWVPQDPEAWLRPKLVFPDISPEPVFWMDDGGSVVNGDCYWIALHPGFENDLLWLALAVGNSNFAVEFYDHKFNNRLYAGRRRFITQYVSEFPLPDPARPVSKEIVSVAKQLFEATPSELAQKLSCRADTLVHEAFGLTVPETMR